MRVPVFFQQKKVRNYAPFFCCFPSNTKFCVWMVVLEIKSQTYGQHLLSDLACRDSAVTDKV